MNSPEPKILKQNILDAQVCVPAEWTDDQVLEFFLKHTGWEGAEGAAIRKEGDEYLCGDPERNPCAQRPGFVHIMIDY